MTTRIGSVVSRAPVALGLLTVIWILALTTGAWARGPAPELSGHIALGIPTVADGYVWTLWTSGLFASGLGNYLLASVFVLAIAVPVEHRIGSRRFAVAVVVSQGAGAALALAAAELASAVPNSWGLELHGHLIVDPLSWVLGAILAATAAMHTLWRRRLRTLLLVILVTTALFAGHLQDVTRLCVAVSGLLIGPVLFGRAARSPVLGGTIRERRTLVALVVAASVLGPIFAAFSPHAVGPLSSLRELFDQVPYSPRELVDVCADPALHDECRRGQQALRLSGVGPLIMNLMPSVVLLIGAEGLRRGRRAAWLLAVGGHIVLIGIAVVSVIVRTVQQDEARWVLYGIHRHSSVYRDFAPLLALLAVLVLLLVTRRLFEVRATRGTYRRVWLGTLAVAGAALLVYTVLGTLLSDGFDRDPGIGTLLRDAPLRLLPPVYLQLFEPPVLPLTAAATVLFEWIGVIVWVTLCLLLLRSFLSPAAGSDLGGARRVRELLHTPGGGSLSWMSTWAGNRYWFAADGRHAVAYRVHSGVALTTTDPIGERDGLAGAIDEFATWCLGNGWTPCFYSVGAETADVAREYGWSCLQVAEETVVELADLAFKGKKFQDVRTALNRAGKDGIEARWTTFDDAPLSVTEQIVDISEEWAADKGLPEMGFTLGGLAELHDPEVRVLLAVDRDDHVHAVTSWMPVYRDGTLVGLTLDFMRRRSDGFRAAMEFLIASAALSAQEEGLEFLSLSGAPLASAEAGENGLDRGALDALLDLLGRTLEPVYGFRSLLAFKAKFQPRHRPMYMVFPDAAALPTIGIAVGRAYLPHLSLEESGQLLTHLLRR
ncbi:bifunctional lysylphosphatidylglycerol flippase/synthetase MprF [Nocardia sp. NPDC003963]